MQRLLGLCGFVFGAVAHHSVSLGQVEVECDQGAVLHAQGPQSRTINLEQNKDFAFNLEMKGLTFSVRCCYRFIFQLVSFTWLILTIFFSGLIQDITVI